MVTRLASAPWHGPRVYRTSPIGSEYARGRIAVPGGTAFGLARSERNCVRHCRSLPGQSWSCPGSAARRVIASWWEATDEERADILALVDEVKGQLDIQLQPDGYNVGFNAGAAAGQTVGH